jgi:SsrA-binding protein
LSDIIIKSNRFASFKYNIVKKFEAGISLKGRDVKAIKGNRFEIRDALVKEDKGELYLWNIIFSDFPTDNMEKRKLLLHKKEIDKIITMFTDKRIHGFVLSVRYNEKNLIKFDIGIGTTKKIQDKKTADKRSSEKRSLERSIRDESY